MIVKDHYNKHLGNFYSWMHGDFNDKQLEQERFFRKNNVITASTKIAFDLGAGHGLQTVSLANLGFSVKAVDFNTQLLTELKSNTAGLSVDIVEEELLTFIRNQNGEADVITCMGDTVSHLNCVDDVEALIKECERKLVADGKLILSFRDLSIELKGEDRFIPIKSDETRIATCFLEYFPEHVMVHDILHQKSNDGWKQKVSAYPKLRLNEQLVTMLLKKNGINLAHVEVLNRMIYMIGSKKP